MPRKHRKAEWAHARNAKSQALGGESGSVSVADAHGGQEPLCIHRPR